MIHFQPSPVSASNNTPEPTTVNLQTGLILELHPNWTKGWQRSEVIERDGKYLILERGHNYIYAQLPTRYVIQTIWWALDARHLIGESSLGPGIHALAPLWRQNIEWTDLTGQIVTPTPPMNDGWTTLEQAWSEIGLLAIRDRADAVLDELEPHSDPSDSQPLIAAVQTALGIGRPAAALIVAEDQWLEFGGSLIDRLEDQKISLEAVARRFFDRYGESTQVPLEFWAAYSEQMLDQRRLD